MQKESRDPGRTIRIDEALTEGTIAGSLDGGRLTIHANSVDSIQAVILGFGGGVDCRALRTLDALRLPNADAS